MSVLVSPFDRGLAPVLDAATRAGILQALERGRWSTHALATSLGLDARALGLVLDALQALGACRVDAAGRWSREPPSIEDGLWDALPRFLVDGVPVTPTDDAGARGAIYADVVATLAARFEAPARVLAGKLAPARRVVDVGAGSGVWSLALLEAWPDARLVALDLPEVLPALVAHAAARGLSDRVELLPGGWWDVAPGEADMVVLANVLHLETPTDAAALLTRAAGWLAPGGTLVVVDAILEGTPARERSRAFYALHLGMRTARGGVHPAATIAGWCAAAGLHDLALLDLDAGMAALGALTARRPG